MENEYIVSPPATTKAPFRILLAGITYENAHYRIARNAPRFTVVEYIISGVGYIEMQNRLYTVCAGDMYILPANRKCTYYADKNDPFKKIWFNADGALLQELQRIYGLQDIVFKNTDGYAYLKKILHLCENKKLSESTLNRMASSIVFELVCFLANSKQKNAEPCAEAAVLKAYLDMHVEENVPLSTLAKQIFRSESQTIRIFKNAYHQTPYDYLLNQKIARASLFLQNTYLPIQDIALRLGFCDSHYFSNLYKKKTEKSPSAFRKFMK